MPIITAIKPQKNKKRVNIYLDDKFAFGLDLVNFVKFNLKVEQELTEGEIEEILKKYEYQKTYDKLLRYVTLRPRSIKEVNSWLVKHKVNKKLHTKLFSILKRLGLVDDEKFALWWVEQRSSFRPRGKRLLFSELRQKGIERKVIKSVLEQIEVDEVVVARELLRKKAYKWERLPKLEARKKMGDFLARKGFKWETIKKVVDNLLEKK